MKVEICANSFESAGAAEQGGADRIELCTQLAVGGLTPSYSLLEKVVNTIQLPIHVLIRPRKGNFVYSPSELNTMIDSILLAKKMGCQGVVSGVLTKNDDLDIVATKQLIEAAKGMDFTFHRAFDCVNDPQKTLQELIDLKITRILSSGQKPTAKEGLKNLVSWNDSFGHIIEIMPGSGVNPINVLSFKEAGFSSIHLSATSKVTQKSNSFFESDTEGVSDRTIIEEVVQLVSGS